MAGAGDRAACAATATSKRTVKQHNFSLHQSFSSAMATHAYVKTVAFQLETNAIAHGTCLAARYLQYASATPASAEPGRCFECGGQFTVRFATDHGSAFAAIPIVACTDCHVVLSRTGFSCDNCDVGTCVGYWHGDQDTLMCGRCVYTADHNAIHADDPPQPDEQ